MIDFKNILEYSHLYIVIFTNVKKMHITFFKILVSSSLMLRIFMNSRYLNNLNMVYQ